VLIALPREETQTVDTRLGTEGSTYDELVTFDVYGPLLVAYARERGWELTPEEAAALRRLGHASVLIPLGRWTKAQFRAAVREVTRLARQLESAERGLD
jgi:hypothetical protein